MPSTPTAFVSRKCFIVASTAVGCGLKAFVESLDLIVLCRAKEATVCESADFSEVVVQLIYSTVGVMASIWF